MAFVARTIKHSA